MEQHPARRALVAGAITVFAGGLVVAPLPGPSRDGAEDGPSALVSTTAVTGRSFEERATASTAPARSTPPAADDRLDPAPTAPTTDGRRVGHGASSTDDTSSGDRPPAGSVARIPPESSFAPLAAVPPAATLPQPACAPATNPSALTAFFDLGEPLLGADYQRAFTLPDGRVLWLFQDAFLATAHGPELVHNVGLVQSGRCFQLLRSGTMDDPRPYLLPDLTTRFHRWFWALAGAVDGSGQLRLFVAEMREHSSSYLVHTEPVATWLVSIELADFSVTEARLAPNPSAALYGWSVVSRGHHTYLYAHCYRQFGWDLFRFADPPFRGHDRTCGPIVTVARVPRADLTVPPEYWDGAQWNLDPAAAVPVVPRESRWLNPTQVALLDGVFVAVTKVGDWWGDTIYLDVASSPQGPWTTYATRVITPECDECNTYFASIVPYGRRADSFVVGLSGNTWEGDDLAHYTPRFLRVPSPPTIAPDDADGV